jgi:SPP1 family predicted phage head-tail adaptor
MNKTKISARKFINLLARNNNYEAAFYYMTQSQTQINESILSDDLIQTLTQNAKDKTYYDFEVCPANQDSSADEMNENLRHPFDLFAAQQNHSEVTGTIDLRYRKDVNAELRAVYDGKIYHINAVIDFELRHKELKLMVSEGVIE